MCSIIFKLKNSTKTNILSINIQFKIRGVNQQLKDVNIFQKSSPN